MSVQTVPVKVTLLVADALVELRQLPKAQEALKAAQDNAADATWRKKIEAREQTVDTPFAPRRKALQDQRTELTATVESVKKALALSETQLNAIATNRPEIQHALQVLQARMADTKPLQGAASDEKAKASDRKGSDPNAETHQALQAKASVLTSELESLDVAQRLLRSDVTALNAEKHSFGATLDDLETQIKTIADDRLDAFKKDKELNELKAAHADAKSAIGEVKTTQLAALNGLAKSIRAAMVLGKANDPAMQSAIDRALIVELARGTSDQICQLAQLAQQATAAEQSFPAPDGSRTEKTSLDTEGRRLVQMISKTLSGYADMQALTAKAADGTLAPADAAKLVKLFSSPDPFMLSRKVELEAAQARGLPGAEKAALPHDVGVLLQQLQSGQAQQAVAQALTLQGFAKGVDAGNSSSLVQNMSRAAQGDRTPEQLGQMKATLAAAIKQAAPEAKEVLQAVDKAIDISLREALSGTATQMDGPLHSAAKCLTRGDAGGALSALRGLNAEVNGLTQGMKPAAAANALRDALLGMAGTRLAGSSQASTVRAMLHGKAFAQIQGHLERMSARGSGLDRVQRENLTAVRDVIMKLKSALPASTTGEPASAAPALPGAGTPGIQAMRAVREAFGTAPGKHVSTDSAKKLSNALAFGMSAAGSKALPLDPKWGLPDQFLTDLSRGWVFRFQTPAGDFKTLRASTDGGGTTAMRLTDDAGVVLETIEPSTDPSKDPCPVAKALGVDGVRLVKVIQCLHQGCLAELDVEGGRQLVPQARDAADKNPGWLANSQLDRRRLSPGVAAAASMTGDPAIRADINLNGTPVRVQYEYARAPKDIILQSPEQELQLKNGDKNVNFMADLDKTLRLNQDEVSFMFNAEIQISETYEATAVEGTASAAYYLGAGAKFLDRD